MMHSPRTSKKKLNSLLNRRSIVFLCLLLISLLSGCGSKETEASTNAKTDNSSNAGESGADSYPSLLASTDDLNLRSDDSEHYSFEYGGTTYTAEFQGNSWRIYDSYRIMNHEDMLLICQALTAEHPIPTADGKGTRTIEDLAHEWDQHNFAFTLLPEGSEWKERARHVDLNPEDQGKELMDFVLGQASEPAH